MAGTVNVLGLEASCNISVNPSEGLFANITLPPLNAGDLLQIYASHSNRSRGPYLIADLRPPVVSVEARGYLTVLGISTNATLLIKKESMSMSIQGSVLGIVDANLTLSAPHSGSFSSAEFQVSGSFSTSIFESIENAIRDVADSAANAADSAIGAAQDVLDAKRRIFDAASRELESARRHVNRLQGEFDGAVREVNRLKDRVNSVCHTRNCGSSKNCYTNIIIIISVMLKT